MDPPPTEPQPKGDAMTFTLTAQEWFNAAWKRAQNPVRCQTEADGCMYSHDGPGGGCFIGAAMPEVHPYMEGTCASGLVLDGEIAAAGDGIDGADLLDALQETHDDAEPGEWCKELRCIAAKYGLAVPESPPPAG